MGAEVKPGDRCQILTAYGDWEDVTALSGVEQAGLGPVVWVENRYGARYQWPASTVTGKPTIRPVARHSDGNDTRVIRSV